MAVDDLAYRLGLYAETGQLEVPKQLNVLVPNEIWEFKAGTLRAPFYTKNADGCGDIRITHCFWKGAVLTPLPEIDKAKAITREDKSR